MSTCIKQQICLKHHNVKAALSCCASGGAGLALLLVLACYRAFLRKKLKGRERQKDEEKESSTAVNHGVHHLGADEKRRDTLWQANSTKPDKGSMDTRLESRGGQVWSRSDEDTGYFRCSDCSNRGQRAMRPNLMTWNNRMNTEMEEDEEKGKRMAAGEEKRIPSFSSQARRETISERSETLPVYETDKDTDSYRVTEKETFHCESCHRSYRAQPSIRAGRFKPGVRDSAPPAHRWLEKGRSYSQFDLMKTMMTRESRNVTFDLEGLGILEQGNSDKRDEKVRTPRDREREKRAKIQVKLNLNPLRKSKVHPRKNNEQDRAVEKGSSKKSRDKRQHGKDRREKAGRGKSCHKMKGSPEKVKEADPSRRRSDDSVDTKEDKDKAEGKHEETVREEQSANPDKARSGDTTSAAATEQVPNSQGGVVQYQGTGLVLGSSFSQSAPERTQTTTFPLLSSAGSQLTGSGLSLQGGNLLLSSTVPGFKAVFPNGAAASAAPISISGALDSFSRQTGLDLTSPSLLANAVHANPLQAGPIQTAPLYVPQAGGLALNLAAACSEPVFQTQLPPDSFSLPPRLTYDPAEALGLQFGEELNRLIPESQVPQIKETLAVQGQAADTLPVLSSQALNTQTEPEHVPGGCVAPAEELAADVTVSGVSDDAGDGTVLLHQEYVTEEGDSSPRRKLKLALPEKTSNRPPTALERKIR